MGVSIRGGGNLQSKWGDDDDGTYCGGVCVEGGVKIERDWSTVDLVNCNTGGVCAHRDMHSGANQGLGEAKRKRERMRTHKLLIKLRPSLDPRRNVQEL